MTKHTTKSWGGAPLTFETRPDDISEPLALTIDYSNAFNQNKDVLVRRADAIILRDMLIERLGLPRPQTFLERFNALPVGSIIRIQSRDASNGKLRLKSGPDEVTVLEGYVRHNADNVYRTQGETFTLTEHPNWGSLRTTDDFTVVYQPGGAQ